MSSRGYIVLVQNNSTTNYLEQAYALALNLKLTQSTVNNLTICVDEHTKALIEQKHIDVFDHIVDIPWLDAAKDAEWKIQNKWKYYYMSPYDETVILDTDMIFPVDVSYWWDILSGRDVWATTRVRTYRGEVISDDNMYRKAFTGNDLPNIYTAFFYFKKCTLAAELFKLIEIIFNNWQRFFHLYVPVNKPDRISGDVAYALAIKLLGIEHLCTRENITSVPTFVHMKSHIQNIPHADMSNVWTDTLPTYYRSCNHFKIGNFQQYLPFHYHEKEWLTSEMVTQLEDDYGNQRSISP